MIEKTFLTCYLEKAYACLAIIMACFILYHNYKRNWDRMQSTSDLMIKGIALTAYIAHHVMGSISTQFNYLSDPRIIILSLDVHGVRYSSFVKCPVILGLSIIVQELLL